MVRSSFRTPIACKGVVESVARFEANYRIYLAAKAPTIVGDGKSANLPGQLPDLNVAAVRVAEKAVKGKGSAWI